jgi:hypothetical protein
LAWRKVHAVHLALLYCLLTACTRSGFHTDSVGQSPDATGSDASQVQDVNLLPDDGTIDDTAPDIDARLPSVDEALGAQAFSAPVPLETVNSPFSEEGPFLSANGLRLYFSSERIDGDANDLWVAERPDLESSFGQPTPVYGVNTANDERDPSLTDDELTIFFERQPSDFSTPRQLYSATRASVAEPFDTPVLITLPATTSVDDPHPSPDGLMLHFASNRTGGQGGVDIWLTTRSNSAGSFGDPALVEGINSTSKDFDPSPAGDWMMFASNRAPGCGGGPDIYLASRAGPAAPYGSPECVDALAHDGQDSDPHLHLGARVVVFVREGDLYLTSF